MSTIIAVLITLVVVAPITWMIAVNHRKKTYESKIGYCRSKSQRDNR